MERYFQERHAAQVATHQGELDEDAYDDITQNGLLPSTKDPNLWIVRCRLGEEKNTCLQLMRKFLAFQNTEEPLQIKSVVVKEGLKGMIYIEAFKKAHVAKAIEGISALNQFQITVFFFDISFSVRVGMFFDIPAFLSGFIIRGVGSEPKNRGFFGSVPDIRKFRFGFVYSKDFQEPLYL